MVGDTDTQTITIENDDPKPLVNWSANQEILESTGSISLTASLDAICGLDVIIPIIKTGTANEMDYTLAGNEFFIPAGELYKTKIITIFEDAYYELDETIIITMNNPENAETGEADTFMATIKNNDIMPIVGFTMEEQSIGEDAGNAVLTWELSQISGIDVVIAYTVTGSATGNGVDYVLDESEITFPSSQKSFSKNIPIVDDFLNENNETIIIDFGDPINAGLGYITKQTINIEDNDSLPLISFNIDQQVVLEDTENAYVTVMLNVVSALDVAVPYTITGSATGSGNDFTFAEGVFTISAGEQNTTRFISIEADNFYENDETIIINLGTPTNAQLGAINTHTIIIENDDVIPKVEWSQSTQVVAEDANLITVTAMIDSVSRMNVKIPYSISGSASGDGVDFTLEDLTQGEITIPTGQTKTTIHIRIIEDLLYEEDETVILTMGSPENAVIGTNAIHSLTIENNDAIPQVFWSSSQQSVTEDSETVSITVKTNAVSGISIAIPFKVSGKATGNGEDHNLSDGTIMILPGEESKSIEFEITDDNAYENSEDIVITMGELSNAEKGVPSTHTITILNDDPIPTVDWSMNDFTINENAGKINVYALLNATSGSIVYVPYIIGGTASGSGIDHSLKYNGTITIPAGLRTGTMSFNIVDDTEYEDVETIILTMLPPTNAEKGENSIITIYIEDNDSPPQVSWFTSSQNINENSSTATIKAILNIDAGFRIDVPFTVSGTATGNGIDHNLMNGFLTFYQGQTEVEKNITIINDQIYDPDESIIITMSTPTNAGLGSISTHTITITDDDPIPTVNWDTAERQVLEGNSNLTVTAVLTLQCGKDVTVPFTVKGTASEDDHDFKSGSITISEGQTEASTNFNMINDELNEEEETIIIEMGTPVNAAKGTISTHTITIEDNDPMPVIQWAEVGKIVIEPKTGSSKVTITALLDRPSGLDISTQFTVKGTATQNLDHDLLNGIIIIPAGETSCIKSLYILSDAMNENSETIEVKMSSPMNSTLGSNVNYTILIKEKAGMEDLIYLFKKLGEVNELK